MESAGQQFPDVYVLMVSLHVLDFRFTGLYVLGLKGLNAVSSNAWNCCKAIVYYTTAPGFVRVC